MVLVEFDVLEHQGLPSPQVKLIQLLPAKTSSPHPAIGLDADTVVPVQLLPYMTQQLIVHKPTVGFLNDFAPLRQ